ncbi:MAG: hypothetical protein AAFU41_07940 [Pseudomonadota bacterium]
MPQNDFSERLRRIEENRQPVAQPEYEPPIRSSGRRSGGRGGGGSSNRRASVVLTVITSATIAAVVGVVMMERSGEMPDFREMLTFEMASIGGDMPTFQEAILESSLTRQTERAEERQAALAEERANTLIAPAAEREAPPVEPVTTGRMGATFGAGFAATASGTPIDAATIIAGFSPTDPNTPVGDLAFFEHNETCTLRPVGADEKYHAVMIRGSYNPAPVQMLSQATIDDTLTDTVKEAVEEGYSPGLLKIARGGRLTADVIVTDTSGPLYLMLQSQSGGTIWNIHAAPGVEIAHIAMIGHGDSGLTGNIGNATFEAVRAFDFADRIDFNFYNGEPEDFDCMAQPYRDPDESWAAWEGAKAGNTLDGNLLFGQSNGFKAYDYWFTQTMGFSSKENAIDANRAGVVLVGDAPTEPLTIPAGPHPLHIRQYDHIITGTEEVREAEIVALYTDILTKAAGGDIAGTIPAASEISPAPESIANLGGERRDFGDLVMNKNDVESVISTTDLNRERRVSFSNLFTWEDILAQGEAMPPEDQQNLYATLRLPRLMQSFCTDTLVEIASKCGMYKATVHNAGDGEFQVRADFAYIPNYNIGDVTRQSNGEFITAHLPDQREGRSNQTPEERRAFLVELQEVCTELRKEYGNCLISVGGFYLDRPATFSGGGGRATAAGWVSVYTANNRFEESLLEEKADEIMAEVQSR